jgi:hypothetical protein
MGRLAVSKDASSFKKPLRRGCRGNWVTGFIGLSLRKRDQREYPSIAVNRVYVRPLSPAIAQESITVRHTTTAFVDMIFAVGRTTQTTSRRLKTLR